MCGSTTHTAGARGARRPPSPSGDEGYLRPMDLRRHAIELLATPQGETRFGSSYLPAQIVARSGCRPHEAHAALWGLLGEGIAYLDPGQQGPDNWKWRLTEVGLLAASGGTWEPRDPDGFLRRLRMQAPDVDPAALVYLDESLRAFGAQCYLSSSVMLGVAAEQVFMGLARAVVTAAGARATKLGKALDNPRSSQNTRFDELRKVLESDRESLPQGLADPLTLDAVTDLLRVTRNDAGHPSGVQIDEDTARTHLAVAGGYLAKMTELRNHFETITLQAAAASSAAPRSGL